MKYIAYGSNMIENHMAHRCPDGRLIGVGHTLVESRAADVGFVFSRISYPNLVSRPVYRELMYLICHKDSGY